MVERTRKTQRTVAAPAATLALTLAVAMGWLVLSEETGRPRMNADGIATNPTVGPSTPLAGDTGTMSPGILESAGSVEAVTSATAVPTIEEYQRTTGGNPRRTRPLGEPAAAPPIDPDMRVEVRTLGDPVQVEEAGVRRMAPRLTETLPQGSSLLILHGSAEGLPPVFIRFLHAGKSLSATIGTRPDRRFNRIRCGDRDVGETSTIILPIKGDLRCVLTADEGTMAFALAVVRR
jgi:hypothetical protein